MKIIKSADMGGDPGWDQSRDHGWLDEKYSNILPAHNRTMGWVLWSDLNEYLTACYRKVFPIS